MQRSGRGSRIRCRTRWIVTVLLVGLSFASTTQAGPAKRYSLADLEALEAAFTELAEKVQPSVVAIRTYQTDGPKSRVRKVTMRPFSQGSGFIIDPDGFIATNRHVISDADGVSVVLQNGVKYDATVVQDDPRSDLAVLKIDASNLVAIRWGSLDRVRVNQWAFACGNPFGMANADGKTSITFGVVSALGRQMTQRLVGTNSGIEYYGNLIETSATINPGNSGGPLFNLGGEVIGVVTAIETSSGVSEGHGFAIPIDKNIRRIIKTLKSGESVRYGFLGITVQDVPPPSSALVAKTAAPRGALVQGLSRPNCPAARAGLRPDDVVMEFDGVPVENSDHLVRLVGYTPVGTKVPIEFVRGGVKRSTVVTVGDRQALLTAAGSR